MVRMVGTIWWDFDGTLVNRPRMWTDAGHRLLTKLHPRHQVSFDALGELFHTGFPWHRFDHAHPELVTADLWWEEIHQLYSRAFRHFGFHELADRFSDIRTDILNPARYQVFEDTVPALTTLASKGWRQIVVSNHVPELSQIVEGLGIAGYFHAVITSGLVGYEKPHRRIFEVAIEQSVPSAPIWMIGDNVQCDCMPVAMFDASAILVRSQSRNYEHCADDLWKAVRLIDAG